MLRKDEQWSRKMFMLPDGDFPEKDIFMRYASTADLKYHDTSIGGNNAMNPLPQSTRYCDPPIEGFGSEELGTSGMGAIYSEAFDDHQQVIYMRFGVPKFNSMFSFLTGFYNYESSIAARTGRPPGTMFQLSYTAATIVAAGAAFAIGGIVPLALGLFMVGSIVGKAIDRLLDIPRSKYYYLKPTMPMYWTNVAFILNYLSINMGLKPIPSSQYDKLGLTVGEDMGFSVREMDYLHQTYGRLFDEDGFVNVLRFASRGQLLARAQEKTMYELAASERIIAQPGLLAKLYRGMFGGTALNMMKNSERQAVLTNYLQRWNATASGSAPHVGNAATDEVEKETAAVIKSGDQVFSRLAESAKDSLKFLQSEFDNGTAFVALRVDYTGQMSESFSNSTQDSEIKGMLNSISSSARDTSFTFMGGNVGDLPVVGEALQGIVNVLKDVAGGVGDRLGISGLAMLGGAAFVDIPKHWQDSTYSGPRFNYTMTLDCVYHNPISRLVNLYLPLSIMLAAALPKATGKQSYTSPYLCELYDRGRGCTRLAMVRDLTIGRGGGNLGFMDGGKVTSMEISFSVEDLSSVMSMPMSGLFDLNISGSVFDEDTVFSDYMATLTGMGLTEMIYPINKIQRNIRRIQKNFSSLTDRERIATWIADSVPGRLIASMYRGVDRQ